MSAELLEQAIALAQAGRQQDSRELLVQVIAADVHNEMAWLLYANALPDEEYRIKALEECLHHNPDCDEARERLAALNMAAHFLEMLRSRNADRRYEACEEFRLAKASSERIVEALEKALHDENHLVADAAQRALNAEVHRQMLVRLGKVQEPNEQIGGQNGQDGMKKCPYCAEQIQGEAIVCRFCGREFDAETIGQMQDSVKTETINRIKKVQTGLAESEGRLREHERQLREVAAGPGRGLVVIVLGIVFAFIWPHLAMVGWLLVGGGFIAIFASSTQVSSVKKRIEHTECEIVRLKAELAELQARLIAW